MKINKSQFNKWIRALRSGKYKQAIGRLENFSGGFCCLGVSCKILIPNSKIQSYLSFNSNKKIIYGTMPIEQFDSPNWLKEISEDFGKKTYTNQKHLHSNDFFIEKQRTEIFVMNDDYRMTFNEIADMLELTYIHNAFEGK